MERASSSHCSLRNRKVAIGALLLAGRVGPG
jgi:hypothetical protein